MDTRRIATPALAEAGQGDMRDVRGACAASEAGSLQEVPGAASRHDTEASLAMEAAVEETPTTLTLILTLTLIGGAGDSNLTAAPYSQP